MKIQYRKSLLRNQEGQAMVEFALVLPVFLLILLGIIEFGWLFSNQLSINNLAREGARYGVVNSTNSNQLQMVRNKVISMIPIKDVSRYIVEASYSNPIAPRTGDIIVKVKYRAKPLTPITGIFTNGDIILSSECIMKSE